MTGIPDNTFEGEYDPSFVEYEPGICQGDVVKFFPVSVYPPQSMENWSAHLGIIVTANCDLARNKHGGILSYVPTVPLEVYASTQTIPRIGEQSRTKAVERLRRDLPIGKGWLSLERILELLADALGKYMKVVRAPWMVDLPGEGDKKFFYGVFRRFVQRLVEEGQMTTDQAFDDFRHYLEGYAWNIRRSTDGYDLILVDEFHLFSDAERGVDAVLITALRLL